MSFAKRLGLWLAATFFSLFLLGLVWTSVGALTIGNRHTVKKWLNESDAYTNIVNVLLDSVKSSDTSSEGSTVPIDRPEIRTIAGNAFSSDVLQSNVEQFLDGTYNWLDGQTKQPVFTMDFTAAKAQLATGIGDYVKTRLTNLPLCPTTVDEEVFDAFNDTCRPKNIDPAKTGAQIADDLNTDQSFLANPVFSAETVKTNQDNPFAGVSQSDPASNVPYYQATGIRSFPGLYRWMHIAPFIFSLLALLCITLMLFTSPSRAQGFWRVGVSLIWTGALLIISVLIFGFAANKLKGSVGSAQSAALQDLLSRLIDAIFGDINNILLWFGLGFALVGGASLATGLALRRHGEKYNDSGLRLAPKETSQEVRDRYKQELDAYLKQNPNKKMAPKESTSGTKERYKKELQEYIKKSPKKGRSKRK